MQRTGTGHIHTHWHDTLLTLPCFRSPYRLTQCPFSAGYQSSFIYILTSLSSEPHPRTFNLQNVSLRLCTPHPHLPARHPTFPHASWFFSAVSSSLMTVNSSVFPFSWIFSLFMRVTISCSLSWAWELDAVAPFPSPPFLDVIIRVWLLPHQLKEQWQIRLCSPFLQVYAKDGLLNTHYRLPSHRRYCLNHLHAGWGGVGAVKGATPFSFCNSSTHKENSKNC